MIKKNKNNNNIFNYNEILSNLIIDNYRQTQIFEQIVNTHTHDNETGRFFLIFKFQLKFISFFLCFFTLCSIFFISLSLSENNFCFFLLNFNKIVTIMTMTLMTILQHHDQHQQPSAQIQSSSSSSSTTSISSPKTMTLSSINTSSSSSSSKSIESSESQKSNCEMTTAAAAAAVAAAAAIATLSNHCSLLHNFMVLNNLYDY